MSSWDISYDIRVAGRLFYLYPFLADMGKGYKSCKFFHVRRIGMIRNFIGLALLMCWSTVPAMTTYVYSGSNYDTIVRDDNPLPERSKQR